MTELGVGEKFGFRDEETLAPGFGSDSSELIKLPPPFGWFEVMNCLD